MDDKIAFLMENQMWVLIELLESKCAPHNKWVYLLKEKNDGTRRYKAMLKGFKQ